MKKGNEHRLEACATRVSGLLGVPLFLIFPKHLYTFKRNNND
jgi:hypothetical protein